MKSVQKASFKRKLQVGTKKGIITYTLHDEYQHSPHFKKEQKAIEREETFPYIISKERLI